MSSGEDLYYVIVAANVELQNILSLLLRIYANVHALSNQPLDGKNALCSLLSSHIDLLKVIVTDYVPGRLYTSEEKTDVLLDVDSKQFDTNLLLAILIKVLLTNYLNGNCSKCRGVCCQECVHSENSCVRCKKNGKTPTIKCWHKCKKCKKSAKECSKTICCTTCNTCLNCNKAILNDLPPNIREKEDGGPCQWFLLTHSLDLSTFFRNLFGHVTVKECEKFITGIPLSENFQMFKICGNLVQLRKYVTFMFGNLVKYAEVKCLELPSPFSEELNGVLKTMDKLNFILEHGVSPKKYLEYLEKAKEIFIEDNKEFCERLKNAKTRILNAIEEKSKNLKDHVTKKGDANTQTILTQMRTITDEIKNLGASRVNDMNRTIESGQVTGESSLEKANSNIREEMKQGTINVTLFRHLHKGFVLKIPFEKHEEISVEYRYNDGSWTEVKADRKIINEIIYLRVERINSTGPHQVRVTLHLDGVKKDNLLEVNVQQLLDKKSGHLSTVTPPSEAMSLLHDHWNSNVCMESKTGLRIIINDDIYGNDLQTGTESDGNTSDCIESKSSSSDAIGSDWEELCYREEMKSAKEFSDLGVRYLERNFVKFKKVLQFPPSSMIKDDLTKHIRKIFSGLLENETGLRAMISNYSDFKYFRFIRDDAVRTEVETLFTDSPSENRLLLFCSGLLTIASIRIVNDKKRILEEISNSFDDLKSFCYTFKRLIDNNVILTILLVCREFSMEEIEEEIKFCFNKGFEKRIKFFFLTKDEFEKDGKSLTEDWWKDAFKKKLRNTFKDDLPDREKYEKMFKEILGQCMATIAWCDRESKSRLPTLFGDEHQQILTLLLSDSQLNSIYSPEKKKLVYGPFGSGKTIVAESLVRLIYESSLLQKEDTKMKTLIVYAIQDDHSLLEVKNKRFVDRLKKDLRKEIGVSDGHKDDIVIIKPGTFRSLTGLLNSKSLLDFVKDVLEKGKPFSRINFVLDEVGHESIEGEGDMKELKMNLENLEKIDHFIIFPRSANLQVQLAGKNKPNESYLYKLFPDDNKYRLKVVLRNSIDIVKAAESCQKSVEPAKSVCKIPAAIHSDDLNTPVTQVNIEHLNARDSNAVSSESPKENTENVSTNVAEENEPFEPANKYTTFQSTTLQVGKEFNKRNETSETLETVEFKTSYVECKPGNKISKGTPKLINLPLTFDKSSDDGAKILSLILDEICLNEFRPSDSPNSSHDIRSPIIICNEMDEAEITYYALSLIKRLQNCCSVYVPQLQRTHYPFNKKEKIYDEIIGGRKILITDNSSFRGMESQHVITFFNPLETFDHHLLPEIMTRATVRLDIIAFHVNDNTATTFDLVNNWLGEDVEEECKLVDVINVVMSPARNVEKSYAFEKEKLKIYYQSKKFKKPVRDSRTFQEFKEQPKEEFRVMEGVDVARRFLFTMAKVGNEKKEKNYSIINEINYEGKHWSFDGVYRLLENKRYTTFRKMFEYDRNILNNLRNEFNNETFLIRATVFDVPHVVEHLTKEFKDNIDVWAVNKFGHNAYYLATTQVNGDVMKLLLSFDRSRLNDGDDAGNTPLHWAAMFDNKCIVKLLLNAGADVDVVDNYGKTPDHLARKADMRKIIQDHRTRSSS